MEKESVVTIYSPAGTSLKDLLMKGENGKKPCLENEQYILGDTTPVKLISKKQNTIQKNEPFGDMILAQDLRRSEQKKSMETKFTVTTNPEQILNGNFKNEDSPPLASIANSTKAKKITPPKIICNHRSLSINNYNFRINENTIFMGNNINYFKDNGGSKYDQIANTHEDMKNSLKDCQKVELGTSNGKSRCSPEVNGNQSVKVSFKERLKLRLGAQSVNNVKSSLKIEEKLNSPKQCKCAECDHFLNCAVWRQNNLAFKQTNCMKKDLPLFKTNLPQNTTISPIFNHQLLLHSNFLLKPVSALKETCFDECIQLVMTSMNCDVPTPVQSYLWPITQRSINYMLISPPQSGKTLTYLPAFCGFAMEKNDRYMELAQYDGPLVLILCASDQQSVLLQSLINKLVAHCPVMPVVEVLTQAPALINCDILIAVPSVLEECVKAGNVSLKRLCHLALEDAHVLFKNCHKSMRNLLNVMNEIQNHRPHNKNIQVVVNSDKWTSDLDTLLNKLYMRPVVCFDDFLEASIYSKVEFKKKKLKAEHRLFYLQDILKTHYMNNKVVVFCAEKEIARIAEHLVIGGVECISVSSATLKSEILENENMWCSLRSGSCRVLLVTDKLFAKTEHVLNANWLVHFSPPSSWQHLQKRFRCMAQNLHPPLDEIIPRYCFFIIEEASNNDLIVNFFEGLTRSSIRYF